MLAAQILTRARSLINCNGSQVRNLFLGHKLKLYDQGVMKIIPKDIKLHQQLVSCIASPFNYLSSRSIIQPRVDHKVKSSRMIVGIPIALTINYLERRNDIYDIALCERVEQNNGSSTSIEEWEYKKFQFGQALRRLWVPSLCVMTISLGWHYPLSLFVNLIVLMWTTKPSPSSIYVWVEQVHHQEALRSKGIDRVRAQAAAVMRVEVRDNMLFCIARVTSLNKRATLVGFLGDWWVIHSSSSAFHTGVNLRKLIPSIYPPLGEQFSGN